MSGFGQRLSTATFQSNVTGVAQKLSDLTGSLGRQMELTSNINTAKASVSDLASNQQPQQGTGDRFYQRKDPTVLFGNIQAGFENDFNDATQVRLQDQGMLQPAV